MKTAVRYYSRTGNTKRIADMIAAAAGCQAKSIEVPLEEETDLLFLGGAIYWGKIPKTMKEYIRMLPTHEIKQVAVFSTSGVLEDTSEIYKVFLRNHNLKVMKESYSCSGKKVFEENTKAETQMFAEKVMDYAANMLNSHIN